MRCAACQTDNPDGASRCSQCEASLSAPTLIVALDLSPGTLFHNRYEIQQLLGQGGMGMVYKARDRTLDEVVAIKVLRPDFAHDPRMAERFRSEIRLARKVRHKNVCTIHDYGEDSGLLFISMELIEGTDLKRLLRRNGPFPPEEAHALAIQVAEGLQAVHEAGIIHRDLKAPNIMLDHQGLARLMDFGIAKKQGEATLTATGQVVGTPEYMSPEQAQGHRVDFRSDIYSLAIVTYELFTGRVPFQGETPISTILKHLNEPPPLDGEAAARLPAGMKPVLRRSLAKAPEDRYATAAEFADAVRRSLSPSLKQQLVPTAVLEAPTLPSPRAGRASLLPWLLLPALAVVGGMWLSARGLTRPPSIAPTPMPETVAPKAVPPSTLPAPEATVVPQATPPPKAAATRPTSPPARPSRAPELAPPVPPPPPTAAAAPPTTLAAAPTGTGLLQIGVKPWAEVTIDGAVVGTTPLDRLALSAGVHTIRLRHPSFEVLERKVTIQAGETEHLVLDLSAVGVRKP